MRNLRIAIMMDNFFGGGVEKKCYIDMKQEGQHYLHKKMYYTDMKWKDQHPRTS